MHGIIFSGLRKYVRDKYGEDTWHKLLETAGLPAKLYLPLQIYPDAELVALVEAACQLTGRARADVLEDFGEFLVPDLFFFYGGLVDLRWSPLDVIEHTESAIHSVVKDSGARPPEIRTTRPSSNEVIITYASPRRLCEVAKGIARGVAKHYDERVIIDESTCMHRGDPNCTISVKLA